MKKVIIAAFVVVSFTSCGLHKHQHVISSLNPASFGMQRAVTIDWCDWSVGENIRYTDGEFYKVIK